MLNLEEELELYKTWYRAKHGDIKNIIGTQFRKLQSINNEVAAFCVECKEKGIEIPCIIQKIMCIIKETK